MGFLSVLWLPILLSAVFVFIASSVLHMLFKYHESGCNKLPAEDAVRAAMQEHKASPGFYPLPFCKMEEMGDPEMKDKFEEGPVAYITVLPNGVPSMAKSLSQWFAFTLGVGVFVAYIAHLTMQNGTDYMMAFRVTGTIATLAYCGGTIMDSIWMGQPWKSCLKFLFDGLVYGLVTAGTFGWLWPQG
jgi:hypothetical protein